MCKSSSKPSQLAYDAEETTADVIRHYPDAATVLGLDLKNACITIRF
jgi:hypothetical protein